MGGSAEMSSHPFLEREVFEHSRGHGYRTEVDVGTGQRGYWVIEDVQGSEICHVAGEGNSWSVSPPSVGLPVEGFTSFHAALDHYLAAIETANGTQTDDVYWEGTSLPQWDLATKKTENTREGEHHG